MAEAESQVELDDRVRIMNRLTRQVFAGNAHMNRTGGKFAGDFGGRQEGDLDIVAAGNFGLVTAHILRLFDRQTGF